MFRTAAIEYSITVWYDDGLCSKLYQMCLGIFAYFFIEEKVIHFNHRPKVFFRTQSLWF